jgi:CDGSH-type Zn-finger protein
MSSEDVVIVPYRDGPYLVRGPLVLRDQDGRAIELGRRTVALCRCGKSRMRPFCDGTHRLVQFRAPSQAESPWGDEAPVAQPPPRPSNGNAARAPAAARLRRARALAAGLEGPDAREARSLIEGANRLTEAPGSEVATLHLVEGALDALASTPHLTALIAELSTAARTLRELADGSWRS